MGRKGRRSAYEFAEAVVNEFGVSGHFAREFK